MRKNGTKERNIKYRSIKTGKVLLVHSDDARTYSKFLEENEEVAIYEVNVLIDVTTLQEISKVDIRGAYFDVEWLSDFLITYFDGTKGVREVVSRKQAMGRPLIEKLELSRRYWNYIGVTNWKVVIIGEDDDSSFKKW